MGVLFALPANRIDKERADAFSLLLVRQPQGLYLLLQPRLGVQHLVSRDSFNFVSQNADFQNSVFAECLFPEWSPFVTDLSRFNENVTEREREREGEREREREREGEREALFTRTPKKGKGG